ncbi:MAG: ArsA-related P-loop ATPase, partial [Micromonosporaceae bacterium]
MGPFASVPAPAAAWRLRRRREAAVASPTVRLAALDWGRWATRFVFFTGKGGVGKTTIAAASAVHLADAG